MTLGTFYGIGVGPGDPELMTVKGRGSLRSAGTCSSRKPVSPSKASPSRSRKGTWLPAPACGS